VPRKQPSDEELREDSHHVLYEMEQMAGAVQRLAGLRATGQNGPEVDENALLESVVMHARGLIEFAYSDRPRPDDVVAIDFLPDWPEVRPPMSGFLAEVKKRTDKEMMHITRERSIAQQLRGWKYGRVHNALSAVLAEFIVRVPKEKVIDSFPKRARDAFPIARQLDRKRQRNQGENKALIDVSAINSISGATHAAPDLRVGDE
jgi:hypothetical protein